MIKYFCDNCNVEITKENKFAIDAPIVLKIGGNEVVLKWITDVVIDEHAALCRNCIFDAVARLDRRAKSSRG